MAELRVTVSQIELDHVDAIAAFLGFEGGRARGQLISHLIAREFERIAYGQSVEDLKQRAATVLSRTLPGTAISAHEIESVTLSVNGVVIRTRLSGEPYRISAAHWWG